MTTTAQNTDRIVLPNLNGLRFFAALSVIIFHAFNNLNGHNGVVLFFALSGFLITYLLLSEIEKTGTINLPKFYMRRVLRIWPLYFMIVGIALALVAIYPATDLPRPDNIPGTLKYYFLFIPNFSPKKLEFANALWSVGAEEQFYLCWPLLLLLTPAALRVWMAAGVIALYTLGPHALDYVNAHFAGGSKDSVLAIISGILRHMYFQTMATGGLIAMLAKKDSVIIQWLFNRWLQVAVVAGTIVLWLADVQFKFVNDTVYSFLFAIIIVNGALNSQTIVKLGNSMLEYLGKISYGLYIYHTPIIFLVARLIPFTQQDSVIAVVLKTILVIGITILVAGLSYKYFEKPFLSIKEKKFSIIKSGTAN